MRKAAVVLALLVLASCQSDDPRREDPGFPSSRTPVASPTSDDSLLIGLVGTLSGPDEWRGEDAFEGAELAVHHLNRARGEGARFELVTRDDQGSRQRATELLRELAADDRYKGIVYAGPPAGLPPAEPAL